MRRRACLDDGGVIIVLRVTFALAAGVLVAGLAIGRFGAAKDGQALIPSTTTRVP
jgi:hypothetical protein